MCVDKINPSKREDSTQNLYPGDQEILTPSAARILWTRIFTGKSCVNPEVRIFRPLCNVRDMIEISWIH